jgi:hypothetical protein
MWLRAYTSKQIAQIRGGPAMLQAVRGFDAVPQTLVKVHNGYATDRS